MIIGSIDLLLAPCATRVRNCGAKPTVVRHQSLSQFMATNIWGTDQDHRAFPIRSWVVEGDLLVDHRLPLHLDLAGVVCFMKQTIADEVGAIEPGLGGGGRLIT